MRKTSSKLGYTKTEKLHLVRIPYIEARFNMVVAIPKNESDHIGEYVLPERNISDGAGHLSYCVAYER